MKTNEANAAMNESPLFTKSSADKCPSARYVGGTSKYLCECADPSTCEGVKAATNAPGAPNPPEGYVVEAVVYDGDKWAFVDHQGVMSDAYETKEQATAAAWKHSGDASGRFEFTRKEYLDGHCTHDQYYGQFMTAAHTSRVNQAIGRERIINSVDAHFNDIPLKLWDAIPIFTSQAEKMRRLGESPTLSTAVSLAKRVAKKTRMANAKVRKWEVKVTYRLVGECSGGSSFNTTIIGTIDGILDYFKSDPINVGTVDDAMANVVCVDFTLLGE